MRRRGNSSGPARSQVSAPDFTAGGSARTDFANGHVVDIVQVGDLDVVSVAGAGPEQGFIADRAARARQERGARKAEDHVAEALGRQADVDRGLVQLNRALIFGLAARVD